MIQLEINNKQVDAEAGERILDVLKREGIHVPTLCHMKDRLPTGACRMCVVEAEGNSQLIPSCAYPVAEGMKLHTHSQRVLRARKTIVELLLANHPDDCLYCVRNRDCELRGLAEELQVRNRRFFPTHTKTEDSKTDYSNLAIVREQSKCILCGRCVRTCEEIMSVSAIDFIKRGSNTRIGAAFDQGLGASECIQCGQCILACPTGALSEKSHLDSVRNALADPRLTVVVQHAPSVSVTLGETFGIEPGKDVEGLLNAALRKLGFSHVFDTSFTADLTIMEEASELVERIQKDGKLPMMTSCSPGWVSFVGEFFPEYKENLSTCKSPQQMLGALIKSHFATKANLSPDAIFSVSLMPCTAKKGEAHRHGDVDAVLTTRELAALIRQSGLDLNALTPETSDTIFSERSSAGKLFGATGGVMEAALRTAHHMITGKNLANLEFRPARGLESVKEAIVKIDSLTLKIAIVSGLGNARKLLEEIKAGLREYHFIEVMTCPGGCIAGGGQPHQTDLAKIKARMMALYQIDKKATLRTSHENAAIQRIYKEFLGAPLGPVSHRLLHVHHQAEVQTEQ